MKNIFASSEFGITGKKLIYSFSANFDYEEQRYYFPNLKFSDLEYNEIDFWDNSAFLYQHFNNPEMHEKLKKELSEVKGYEESDFPKILELFKIVKENGFFYKFEGN